MIKRCVEERPEIAPRTILGEDFEANPRRGNANVLKTCRENLPWLASRRDYVFAVYDADKAHELVGLAKRSCMANLVAKLKAGCEPAERLRVALLQENLETVLTTLRCLEAGLASPADWEDAERKKNVLKRDTILNRAANDPARRQLREQLCSQMPSFGRLVARIADLLRADRVPEG